MIPIKARKADVWFLAGRAFPDYKGKTFRIKPDGRVTFYDLAWGGGTRNYYRAVQIAGDEPGNALPDAPPWANPAEGKTADIPGGWVVVQHAIFCGRDLGIVIHANAKDMAPLLDQNKGRTEP